MSVPLPEGFAHRRDEMDEGFQMFVQDLVADPAWASTTNSDTLLKIKERGGIKFLMKQSLLLFDLTEDLKRAVSGDQGELIKLIQGRLKMLWEESDGGIEEVRSVVQTFAEACSLWHDLEIDGTLE
jgi:hypothetical protein